MKTKTAILLLLGIFLAQGLWAGPAKFTLKLFNNDYFVVTFDNVFYKNTTNFFTLDNVTPGNHSLKVTRKGPGTGHQYGVNVIFNGSITIPAGFSIDAMLDKNNNYVVLKKIQLSNPVNPNNNEEHHHHHNRWQGDNYNGMSYQKAMNMEDFQQLKMSISTKSFDNSKLEIAKQAAASNWFLTDQVVDLVKLFSFENSKLEFAKFAYSRTLDKNKYYLINNAFSFESSISNLNKYISTYH